MKRALETAVVISIAAAALLSGGCVSQDKYDALETELAACQEEKAAAQAAVLSWEERYDRETARWDSMEASISDAVPDALVEFREEKERILELVPEQVKFEVEGYLEDYFNTVMKGFELMQKDNQEIKFQLAATQKALEAVGADTRSIGQAIDEAVFAEQDKRDHLSTELAALLAEIATFDNKRLNCKGCKERLRLNKKNRAEILEFHGQLMTRISELQTFAGE